MVVRQYSAQLFRFQALRFGPHIARGVELNLVEVVADFITDQLGEMTDGEFFTGADIDEFVFAFCGEASGNSDEVVNEDEFSLLVTVSPENNWFAVEFAVNDFANQVEDEMELAIIRMVARAIQGGRDQTEVTQAVLALKGEQSDVEHAFGVAVGEEAFDG